MLVVDGAQQSGSGTIVRYAVALAALLGRPVRVVNAKQFVCGDVMTGWGVDQILAQRTDLETCSPTQRPARPRLRFGWPTGTLTSSTVIHRTTRRFALGPRDPRDQTPRHEYWAGSPLALKRHGFSMSPTTSGPPPLVMRIEPQLTANAQEVLREHLVRGIP
jgi:hypothetical protein